MTGSRNYTRVANVRLEQAALIFAGLVIVVARAMRVPITYDESYTQWIAHRPAPDRLIANNHWINTLAVTVMDAIGPHGVPLLTRLPSVVSFVLFAAAALWLTQRIRSRWVAAATMTVLIANPMSLEFFSLARGYGQASALITLALVGLLANTSTEWLRVAKFAALVGLATAAFYANFAVLPVSAALVLVGAWRTWTHTQTLGARAVTAIVGITLGGALTLLPGLQFLTALKSAGLLYFGAESVITGSLPSLVTGAAGGLGAIAAHADALGIVLGLALMCLAIYAVVKGSRSTAMSDLATVVLISVAIQFATHTLTHSAYPTGRTLVPWLPPIVLMCGYAVDSVPSAARLQTVARVTWTATAALVTAGLLAGFTVTHSTTWPRDADSRNIALAVRKELGISGAARFCNLSHVDVAPQYYLRAWGWKLHRTKCDVPVTGTTDLYLFDGIPATVTGTTYTFPDTGIVLVAVRH